MTIPNAEERLASEKYQSYMRGWRDGAAGKPKRMEFIAHKTREDLATSYGLGYTMGEDARIGASAFASQTFGYKPSILRGAERVLEDLAKFEDRWLAQHFEFGFACAVQGWDKPPAASRDDVTQARAAGFEAAKRTVEAYEQSAKEQGAEWVAAYRASRPEGS